MDECFFKPLGRSKPTKGFVTVARFATTAPAQVLCDLLNECGIPAELCGPLTGCDQPTGFDGSLGGFDSGRMVELRLPPTRQAEALEVIKREMKIGAKDPLRKATIPELRSIARGENDAGIQEQAAAQILLAEDEGQPA